MNPSQVKRTAVTAAISLIALTGLLVGNATPEMAEQDSTNASLEAEVAAVEASPSFSERAFLESIESLESDAAIAEFFAKWKEQFTYTAAGGLKARNSFCERFIDQDGNYGAYGKVVAKYLREKLKHNRSTPMLADDLVGMEKAPKICPNWRKFDDELRIKFWTWTFAAMASLESSCGADTRAIKGVRGVPVYKRDKKGNVLKDKKGRPIVSRYKIAIGLLQMEKAKSDRSWRDLPTCDVADSEIGNTTHNLKCGIDIMEGLISADPPRKNPWPIYPGPGMNPTSYWLKLRKVNGGTIGELIRSFSPCRGKFLPTTPKAPLPSPTPSGTPKFKYTWDFGQLFGEE